MFILVFLSAISAQNASDWGLFIRYLKAKAESRSIVFHRDTAEARIEFSHQKPWRYETYLSLQHNLVFYLTEHLSVLENMIYFYLIYSVFPTGRQTLEDKELSHSLLLSTRTAYVGTQ